MSVNPLSLPTVTVEHPVMIQRWEKLTFIHWRYEAADIQRLLPKGLHVEESDGSAWIGLVPFRITVGLPRIPPVPWLSVFPESNVRTYVRDDHGRVGIWFFSLEAARLSAVLTAKTTYRLPYMWAKMSITETPGHISYASTRRWPGPKGAACNVDVEIGEAFKPHDLSELDHFLTARWRLFSNHYYGAVHAHAVHEAWPLQKAKAVIHDSSVIEAAGLPTPQGQPLVHYAERVNVRIGMPRLVTPKRSGITSESAK